MARVRRHPLARVGGVPAPLVDPAGREWHDESAYGGFLDLLGFEPVMPQAGFIAICSARYSDAVDQWARSNGFVSEKWPATKDHAALRSAGIPTGQAHRRGTCPHLVRK